jgi:hypothetical protein
MRNVYLAPRDHPSPDTLRSRLDEAALRDVPAASGAALERALDPEDGSLWFIRRLQIDFTADAGSPRLGAFWGERIAREVLRAMARGENGEEVLRFENRDHYAAAFAADMAAGRAWTRWCYRAFDSLRVLRPGEAIREAILRETGRARAIVLRVLALGRLGAVLDALSDRDAREILHACDAAAPHPEPVALMAAQWAGSSRPPAQTALELAARTGFEVEPARVEHFVFLMALIESRRLTLTGDYRRDVEAARSSAPPGAVEALASLGPEVESLARAVPPPEPASDTNEQRLFDSPYTAVFLLLPAMLEAAPEPWLATPERRFVLVCELLGCRGAREALADPALMLACGLDRIAAPDLEYGAVELAADAIRQVFASHLLGFRESTFEFLRANFFSGRGAVRCTPARIDVELPRAPLGIVLRLAGVHGRVFMAPWIGTPIRLRLPEE